ncbi:GUN4 domain-containing protein [Oscillatoria sp. FACHB-1406]|uniref:GUN4 domain-containing protein n=1 Tax=Oscillatoria sp. FACHB-1406 TaxID=2692846 RepID=UPI0016863806|nr:GUN4 domain-containing protein [Oscillatoria sp. FACHB-1406]MBD2577373.1 GUN4 domain-containing protein [Oscillatoria sp. FACHB-1406]
MGWQDIKQKAWKIGSKIFGSIVGATASFVGKKIVRETIPISGNDRVIATILAANDTAMQAFAIVQNQLAKVQARQNQLKKTELMLDATIAKENLAVTQQKLAHKAQLARQERELKLQLSKLWCNLKRELQQNEFQQQNDLQARQIQADWDKTKLPTIFSRHELEKLAEDTQRPLFVCAKMQITEGCPNYFRTELAAETESQIKTFANSVFKEEVRFYSRFFDNEAIFDTNAAQLQNIIPQVPCVMSFSKVTRRSAHLHYQLWGSQSAKILHGHLDLEVPWRDLAQQLQGELAGEAIDDDDLYETIGDWLTALQKIYALFAIDLYQIVDGEDPFYSVKLESIDCGLPETIARQFISPLVAVLQEVQTQRLQAFNEELHRPPNESEQQSHKASSQAREEAVYREVEYQPLTNFTSARGMEFEYQKLDELLVAQKWQTADESTRELMLRVTNRIAEGYLDAESIEAFPCEDLRTIDKLWVERSGGKFGFSVQKKLWQECGGKIDKYDDEAFKKFATKVGWYQPHKFGGTYNEFLNDTDNGKNARYAAFPATILGLWCGWGWWAGGKNRIFYSLVQRIISCSK